MVSGWWFTVYQDLAKQGITIASLLLDLISQTLSMPIPVTKYWGIVRSVYRFMLSHDLIEQQSMSTFV